MSFRGVSPSEQHVLRRATLTALVIEIQRSLGLTALLSTYLKRLLTKQIVRRNIENPPKVYIFVDNSNSQSKLTVFRAVLQSCIAEPRLKLQVGVLGCRV
jgi:hypothetical protein